jgi:DNA-binding XRE family transcriptional regulator
MNPNDLKSNCNTPQQGVSQLAERRGIVTEEGMLELGKRVEHFRKKCGIMQVDMAEKLGIAQTISRRTHHSTR